MGKKKNQNSDAKTKENNDATNKGEMLQQWFANFGISCRMFCSPYSLLSTSPPPPLFAPELPLLPEWLSFNKTNVCVRIGVDIGPACFLLSLSGGHVEGYFSPYEAFPISGTNSVRGYEEGVVGFGRSYIVHFGEISFPVLRPVEGVLFSDYGAEDHAQVFVVNLLE